MHDTNTTPTTATSTPLPSRTRTAARWMVSFVGFPLGGLAAKLLIGPIDSRPTALLGGLLTGAVLGAVQSWGLGRHGPSSRQWISATAAGLALGLTIGASLVDFDTTLSALVLQGAVSGLAVGLAQAIVLRQRLGAVAVAWPAALAAIWAAGWAITTSAGIDVEAQYTVFGSSGALTVTALTVVLPLVLRSRGRERIMSRHVVFGTGQVGRPVVEQLVAAGHEVTAVNRSGGATIPGSRPVAGDATDPAFTERVTAGADVVYFCLNAASYLRWDEEFPPLQNGVLAGAAAAGARLVVLDNLYSYGPTNGRDLVETLPPNPTSSKSATRAAMTAELLAAHADGRVEVAIGRASDYFGPGTVQSALGETVFGPALNGRRAQVMGDPSTLHSYSYTPDVAASLIQLGTRDGATGSVWHLPVAETRTTAQIIDHVYAAAGHRPRTLAAGRTTLRLLGIVQPAMREYLHTLYQFTDRWVVDDTAFRTAFGDTTTPLDDALDTTLEWYRARSMSDEADR